MHFDGRSILQRKWKRFEPTAFCDATAIVLLPDSDRIPDDRAVRVSSPSSEIFFLYYSPSFFLAFCFSFNS